MFFPLDMDTQTIKLSKSLDLIFVGDNLTLTCNVQSNPSATYTWYFNNNIVSQTSELSIENITETQHGEYMCVSNNDVFSKSTTINVNVECKL